MAITFKLKDNGEEIETITTKHLLMTIIYNDKVIVEGIPLTDRQDPNVVCKEFMTRYIKEHTAIKKDVIDSAAAAKPDVEEVK